MDWQERFEARLCEEISLKQVYPLASQPRIFLFGLDPLGDDVDSEIETDLADRTQFSTTGPIRESPLDPRHFVLPVRRNHHVVRFHVERGIIDHLRAKPLSRSLKHAKSQSQYRATKRALRH